MGVRPFVILLALTLVPLPAPGAVAHGGAHAGEAEAEAPVDWPGLFGTDTEAALAAARDAGLFGRFDENGTGAFVSAIVDAANATLTDVRFGDALLLEAVETRMQNATVHAEGPVLALENGTAGLSLHDNKYAWLTHYGEADAVVLTLPANATATAEDARRVHVRTDSDAFHVVLHAPARMTVDGARITITETGGPVSFSLTRTLGVFGADAHAMLGSWMLVARAGDAAVVDAIRPVSAEFRVDAVSADRVDVAVVGALGKGAPDVVFALETVGVFEPDARERMLVKSGLRYLGNVPGDVVLSGEGLRVRNVTSDADGTRFLARLPGGEGGLVTFLRDAVPPHVVASRTENLTDAWDPTERVPLLVMVTDEAALARLVIEREGAAPYEKATVTPALEQRFRLVGLAPDTPYAYTVTLTDLAGNARTVHGNFTTPPTAVTAAPRVEMVTPMDAPLPPGDANVTFRVTRADGTPPAGSDVTVFLDKRAMREHLTHDGDGTFTLALRDLAPGRHDLVIETRDAAGERVVTTHTFTVAKNTPAPGAVALAALLAAVAVTGACRLRAPRD